MNRADLRKAVRAWTLDTLASELAKLPADVRERAHEAWRETFPAAAALFARGQIVEVGLAYSMETRSRSARDGAEGLYTIVDVRGSDALLVRGDARRDLPDPGEWQIAINVGRLTRKEG